MPETTIKVPGINSVMTMQGIGIYRIQHFTEMKQKMGVNKGN